MSYEDGSSRSLTQGAERPMETTMRLLPFLIVSLLAAPAAAHEPPAIHVASTIKGSTLVDTAGMTLYVFDRDIEGRSVCNGPCATNWPPVMAEQGFEPHGDWSIVTRDDGSRQWAYRSRPLYRWSHDENPGDIRGDNFLNGTWHVALTEPEGQ